MQRHPGAGEVHSAGAWWVPDPVSLGSCSCHPTRSPAWEMCCGCRMWERTKPVGAEPAQPLRHGVIADGLWSILLRAVGSNRGVTAGTWGWGTCHSTPLPGPGAACASLEEPQGVMRLQAAKTVDTPQGYSWAMVGAAATGRQYGSCPAGAPELRGLPRCHGGGSWYPSLGDAPARAAYNAGTGHSMHWDMGARGPRRPHSHSDAHSGGPGTLSPSPMENPSVECPPALFRAAISHDAARRSLWPAPEEQGHGGQWPRLPAVSWHLSQLPCGAQCTHGCPAILSVICIPDLESFQLLPRVGIRLFTAAAEAGMPPNPHF